MEKILVPLDGSVTSEAVIPLVRALAQGLGWDIHLLHVVDTGALQTTVGLEVGDRFDVLLQREQAQAASYLDRVSVRLAGYGLRSASEVAFGEPAEQITLSVWTHGAGIIAMTTHGRTGLARWVLGSVADKVLRTSDRPVLLYHPTATSPATEVSVSNILLPLDGTPESEASIPWAVKLARALDRKILVARVASVYGLAFVMESPESTHELIEAVREEADEYLRGTVKRLREEGVQTEKRLIIGEPAGGILGWAGEEHGILVMSAHARTGLERTILGSVTDRVVRSGIIPVLVIPPGAHPKPASALLGATTAGRR